MNNYYKTYFNSKGEIVIDFYGAIGGYWREGKVIQNVKDMPVEAVSKLVVEIVEKNKVDKTLETLVSEVAILSLDLAKDDLTKISSDDHAKIIRWYAENMTLEQLRNRQSVLDHLMKMAYERQNLFIFGNLQTAREQVDNAVSLQTFGEVMYKM